MALYIDDDDDLKPYLDLSLSATPPSASIRPYFKTDLVLAAKGFMLPASPATQGSSTHSSSIKNSECGGFNTDLVLAPKELSLSPPSSQESSMTIQIFEFSSEGRRSEYAYKCSICGKGFRTHQALGGHKTAHRIKPPASSSVSSNRHTCNECGESFEKGQSLGGHMRKHYNKNAAGKSAAASRAVKRLKFSADVDEGEKLLAAGAAVAAAAETGEQKSAGEEFLGLNLELSLKPPQ